MSSLRLALKQSLQESGGGSIASGHGEKKKRKKKKNGNGNGVSSNNSSSSEPVSTTGKGSTKKGRRDVDPQTKPKRGRPRKIRHSQLGNIVDIKDMTLGDDEHEHEHERPWDYPRKGRPRNSKHGFEEDEDDPYGEFFYESSDDDDDGDVSEEESDEESEDDDGDDDDDDDTPYRRRSRSRQDYDEDEGEYDEMSDWDPEIDTVRISGEGVNLITEDKADADNSQKEREHQQQHHQLQHESDSRKETSPPNVHQSASEDGLLQNPSVIQMGRKHLKLKKKFKNENSAANKIQTQWKKKKVKGPSPLISVNEISTTTDVRGAARENVLGSKPEDSSTPPKFQAHSGAHGKRSPTGTDSQQKLSKENGQPPIEDAAVDKKETEKSSSLDASKTKSSTAPSAAAEDVGKTGDANDAEAQPPPLKKKKKKKKDNGIVPAPTREVREWSQSMSEKKARKHIQVGMRVKVRFSTKAKRDGKAKKIYYGGRVTGVSTKRTKIKIKYDDGTSELSDFPDRDVVVDAVHNGEHSVPADKFMPPPPEEPVKDIEDVPSMTEKDDGIGAAVSKTDAVVKADDSTEAEEGEVKEEEKSGVQNSVVESSETTGIQISKEPQASEVKTETVELSPKPPVDTSTVPTSESCSPVVVKDEKTKAVLSTSIIQKKDDVEIDQRPSSEEEGELSPGITFVKNSENASEKPDQITLELEEANASAMAALLPSKVGTETTTTEPIKFAANETQEAASKDDTASSEKEKSDTKIVTDLPSKPKKLSIRIPSNSLATIKSLSSPKSNGSAKSPKPAPSPSDTVAKDEDNISTPDTSKDLTVKRKWIATDAAAPSVEVAPEREMPSKKRIKVAIGKRLLESAISKTQSNDDSTGDKPSQNEDTSEEGLVKEELAPVAEEAIPAAKAKKKTKKADRAKSPRPKSPMPVQELNNSNSKNKSSEITSILATPKQQKIGSKGSAFSAKKSTIGEEESTIGTKQTAAKSSLSAELTAGSASLRAGRKAAEEAKEKLIVKQKAKPNAKETKEREVAPLESGKKKKKRRREKEVEEEGEEEVEEVEPNETEWVQCDKCKKWRILPDNVRASSLPDLWYCHMNIYDPKRSKCEAPEQNMKQILRERKKRARKKAKREAELSESQHEKPTKKTKQQEEETPVPTKKKSKQDKLLAVGGTTPRSTSPKPPKSAKSSGAKSKESVTEIKKAVAESKKLNVEEKKKSKTVIEDQPTQADSGSDTQKEVKKKNKKNKKESQENTDNVDTDAADSKKSGRKRGRPARNQSSSSTLPSSVPNDNEDEDNVEWVQCDKCEKWRKLPPDISADELPDIWNCSMNTWNPSSASCEAAEDKTDAHHQEVGASEWQLRQLHAGKYSYRQMIFGNGARKQNRPLSERARAAESLFIQPTTDEDQPHPTTQYSKSSAFLPRISNFQKNLTVEENNIGIFDVLRNSNLWEELRSMDMKPPKVLSSSTGDMNVPGLKLKTYEFLSDEIKHAMQDIVLQTLEFGCLTGDEVVVKAQWFPYETSIKGVAGIRGYCNEDIIVHTLLDLVRDGLVEMATVRDPFLPMTQWVPRYRRVGTRRAMEAVEAIKASRCMKIAKPWKQRTTVNATTTEWVTGQKAN